jgi:hypothetical protein
MRRVNACPRLDEAGVVVVAAGRQLLPTFRVRLNIDNVSRR